MVETSVGIDEFTVVKYESFSQLTGILQQITGPGQFIIRQYYLTFSAMDMVYSPP